MDSLFHFIFPIIAALAARVHVKHLFRNIFIVAVFTMLIDIDHFIGVERATFHNVFLTILLPILFIIYAFSLKKEYQLKGFSILLLVFLSSHMILDVFTEPGVALFYPLSENYYPINFEIPIPIQSQFTTQSLVVSSVGVGVLIYFILIIIPCLFLDQIIKHMEKKHESFRRALKDFTG